MTFVTLTIGTLQVLLKPILLPHVGTTTMGQVETAAATGILAGAGLVTALARLRPTTLLTLGTAGAGAAMVLLALRVWPWWAAVTGFAVFASLALCNAGAETLVRMSVDGDYQARAWGTISLISQLGYVVAYVSAGPLADRVLQPLLTSDGALAHGLGAVMGTGTGRGAALLVALAGLVTIGLAAVIHSRRRSLTPPSPAGGQESPQAETRTGTSGPRSAALAERAERTGRATRSTARAVPC